MKARDLAIGYTSVLVSGIDLELRPGTITVLLGRNGCGKSTLLKTLAGIVQPKGGSVTEFDARKTAVVLQQGTVPDMTVFQLVLHGRFCHLGWPRRYRKEDRERAQEAIDQLGIEHMQDCRMGELSGGQQQRVWLAMAAAQDTPEILLDEPGTWLDRPGWLELKEILLTWKRQGKALLVVLHDVPEALEIADVVLVLHEGRTVYQGSPEGFVQSDIPKQVFGEGIIKMQVHGAVRYLYEGRKGIQETFPKGTRGGH